MRLGLSSNSRFAISSAGPMRIFSTLGGKNSHRVLVAIALGIGDELLP
jgi:hypothetical protein